VISFDVSAGYGSEAFRPDGEDSHHIIVLAFTAYIAFQIVIVRKTSALWAVRPPAISYQITSFDRFT
jgi:hypothetical protein